jgi:adenylate cyclase
MSAETMHISRTTPLKNGWRHVDAQSTLELETLSTEKLRVLVLTIVIGTGLCLSLVPPTYFANGMEDAFHGEVQSFAYWRFIVLLGLILYVLAERILLSYFIKSGRRVPTFYRYGTAFIETSCPTIEIMVLAAYADPIAAFSTTVVAYPLFIILSALRLDFRLSVFTGAVAALEYTLVGLVYLKHSGGAAINPMLLSVPLHVVKGFILLSLGVVTGFVALQIKRRILDSFRLAEERNNIVNKFGQHVSQVVVDKLLKQGAELQSEKRNVCVMFLDIRNFTQFAELRSPEEVVSYLESLFGFMIEIVNRHHGFINKFLGDGFMAVFGAPLSNGRDCPNAVAAAQEILARVNEEVDRGRILPTTVGIGLHAGEAVTGNIGSSLRKEYTVIGDVVNLASRIEQLNKQFGSQLLISETVCQAVGDALAEAPMGHVQVKGREAPITIYKIA